MLFKSLVLFTIATLFFICLIMINEQPRSLKRLHSFDGSSNKHKGYWNGDLQCTANCQARDGISCGQAWQNCCRPSQCINSWYGAKNCEGRIAVPGCTELND